MIFGAQYYRPPFPGRECWERDLAHMRELGFNTVKLWAVWNWIEKQEGEFDFSELDDLVAISAAQGLEVILNTIPEGAPYWTLSGNEDALYVTKDGLKIGYGGPPNLPSAGWPGLCPDKPGAAALVERFIGTVAAHYRDVPAVVAIDVWNEPHLEPMFDYRTDMLCYCEHSVQEFRAWLKCRYGSLEVLNETWFRRYSDWSEVLPPPRFGTWTDMMDWRLFWLANLRRWLRDRVLAAKRGAPEMVVQTHVAYSATLGNKLAGGLANELGDEFSLAPEVDVFGLSSFPKWLQGKNHVYVHLAHNEIVAEASREKEFYQVELQGGGGKAGLLGGEVPDRRDVTLWNYNTVAAGGKGVLYWQYAPEPAGLESPGFGLTGFAGQDTERSLAAADCARALALPELDVARRVRSSNGIYLSRHSEVLCFCDERREELYAGSVNGVYKAAYLAGIPVRFVHEDYLGDLAAGAGGHGGAGVKGAEGAETAEGADGPGGASGAGGAGEPGRVMTLYMPMPLVVSEDETAALLRFVESGGTLVAEAGFGLYDRHGKLDQSCRALRDIFGLEHVEIQALPDWGFAEAKTCTGGSSGSPDVLDSPDVSGASGFTGKQYRQVVQPEPGVTVLAQFEDGCPALTERILGTGRALFVATFAALAFHEREDPATGQLITSRFVKGGYPQIRSITVKGDNARTPSLWPVARLHETGTGYLLVLVNHLKEPATFTFGFNPDYAGPETLVVPVAASSGLVYPIPRKSPQPDA